MLRAIPRHPSKVTTAQIKRALQIAGFEVTPRTIQRDLLELSNTFPLTADERERPYGWSWQKDASGFDLPNLSTEEALALAMIERYLRPLLPGVLLDQLNPQFARAKARLGEEASLRGGRSWLGKVAVVQPTQALIPPQVNPGVQAAVTNALLLDRQLKIRYRPKGESAAREYTLNPHALVLRGQVSYVLGTLWEYDEVLTFAVHRIQQAAMLKAAANRRKDFSLEAAIAAGKMDFGTGKRIRLEAIFDAAAADHLTETPLAQDQVMTPVDRTRVRLRATLLDTAQLRWWLHAFGDNVEVVAPAVLRREFARVATAMAASYATGRRARDRTR
jgi:predicted DNA-binding transcriptional regulator YafY